MSSILLDNKALLGEHLSAIGSFIRLDFALEGKKLGYWKANSTFYDLGCSIGFSWHTCNMLAWRSKLNSQGPVCMHNIPIKYFFHSNQDRHECVDGKPCHSKRQAWVGERNMINLTTKCFSPQSSLGCDLWTLTCTKKDLLKFTFIPVELENVCKNVFESKEMFFLLWH